MGSERDERRSSRAGTSSRKRPRKTAGGPSSGDFPLSNSDREEHSAKRNQSEPTGPIPEIVRKALALGLAGFFTTEQTIRKALGDTLPKEWIDFMTDQSERTRGDLTEAIASEVGRSLKTIDLTQVADQLLTGRTLEVSARIRLLPLDNDEKDPEESNS